MNATSKSGNLWSRSRVGGGYVESVDGKLLRGRVSLCYTELLGFLLKAGHSDKISSVRGLGNQSDIKGDQAKDGGFLAKSDPARFLLKPEKVSQRQSPWPESNQKEDSEEPNSKERSLCHPQESAG